MRIRPVLVTLMTAGISFAAVGVIVLTASPQETGKGIIPLLWLAIFLGTWGLVTTLLLMARQSMAQAVWVGMWPALSAVWLLVFLQRGLMSQRLLVGIVLATLLVSFAVWWRLRRQPSHD